ncbi:MAG: efflux RND transporter periplasmic adaptor subunit [Halorhodospira sp.]
MAGRLRPRILAGRRPLQIAGVLALAAVLGLGAWGVMSRKAELAGAPRFQPSPVAVHTATAEAGSLERSRRYLAEAEAVRSAALSARVTERITAVATDEGEAVAEGETLVRLDASAVEARLDGVAADLEQAQAERAARAASRDALEDSAAYWARELERLRQLREDEAASQSAVDEAAERVNEVQGNLAAARQEVEALTARVASLRARRAELRQQRADYTLEAPFDGVVTERAVDPGDQAAPGKALVRVSSTERMRLAFGVPRADRPVVAPGRTVRFQVDGSTREAAIARIHPALDAARLARAEVDLAAGKALPPGAEVAVEVALPPAEGTALIPAEALAGGERRPTVYVVDDGEARARAVTVQGRADSRVAVSGVEPEAKVVTTPYLGWTRLADGTPVTEVTP